MRAVHVGVVVGAVLVSNAAVTSAHFKLLEPASWLVANDRGDPQKAAPCGGDAKDKGTPSNVVGKGCRRPEGPHPCARDHLPSWPLPRCACGELSRRAAARSGDDDEGHRKGTAFGVGGRTEPAAEARPCRRPVSRTTRGRARRRPTRRTSSCRTSTARNAHCRLFSGWPSTG